MGKTKLVQKQIPESRQKRDLFQTPNYATRLLIPYIPQKITHIWECATSENGKISSVLREHKYNVFESGLGFPTEYDNFLVNDFPFPKHINCAIITNPPYSLKFKFISRSIEHDVPFAFLIPFDMCKTLLEFFSVYGCQALVPNRRIDYITPNGFSGADGKTSDFHSFWLTRYFDLPNQITEVELSNQSKKEDI